MTLLGKKILLTGASSGIGEALALALFDKGASLFLVARRADRLQALAQKTSANYLAMDITQPDFVSELEKKFGLHFDGLINNAGLALGRGPYSTSLLSDSERMLQVNVEAAFRLTHALLPKMLEQGGGDILNLCSIAGHWTYPGGAIYCATKHALWAFTKALREETCGKNLRVMQISPGMVESEFSEVRFKGDKDKAREVYQGMTPLSPADIARMIVFMLEQPRHVCIDELITMPTDQGSPTTVARRNT
ncbi:MAG: SDR family oxidoreductase [Proteobacteria bacterium]|jgi:NADP-dependent 3-hydroxy acid dehydrogenase YdfG|nr:SDR family oxidoreductase [Pseudomonadota bacterium]